MAQSETTAAELVEAGVRPRRAAENLRNAVLERVAETARDRDCSRMEALDALFPGIVLEPATLESLTAALLAGTNILFLGPPGSGKTTLAKSVWDLFPKEALAVADCPVHDDPFSLFDAEHARRVPPCPYCVANHGGASMEDLGRFDPEHVDPADVPVRRVNLREGYGFARVQGSPEVFPDNLTGTLNLARLEEIGDPTSPLVLEPGKVLQAHRGVLLVDEVGKLPRGTQNVLLQALQEGIVSPAKSRETFPSDIVCVATSNLRDLANITEPLNDRLANVHTPFPSSHAANRRIVDLGLAEGPDGHHVPGPYRDAAVELMQAWRGRADGHGDLSEVASTRTLLDILRRSQSYALMAGTDDIAPDDFRRGALDAMTGRVRARSEDGFDTNRDLVEAFLEEHWSEAARRGAEDYWCRFFEGVLASDKAEGARVAQAVRDAVAEHGADPSGLQPLLRERGGEARLRRFADFVREAEGVERQDLPRAVLSVARALDGLGAFDGED